MDEKVKKVFGFQGDTIHPLDVPERRKICRPPDSLTVYHTTRLCERLMQPKSEFDLTDPRGFLVSSEYNSLHDPNLRGYLFRKDIHRRLFRGGFITKDDKVICSLRTLNKYREQLADVEMDWSRRFRAEQKEVLKMFLTLQDHGRISSDVTVTDVTDWALRSGKHLFENPNSAYKSRSSSGLSLQRLPAIARRCSAIEVSPGSTGRSELIWSAKGSHIMEGLTKELQRERRLESRWITSKQQKEKKREEWIQKNLMKMEDLARDVEKSESLQKPLSLQSQLHGSRNHIFASAADVVMRADRVYSSRQSRNASLVYQRPFIGAKKKLSAICQKLVTRVSSSHRPATACDLHGKMTSTPSVSSHQVDIQQTLLQEHFKGMITPEELQVVLQSMVVTLVDEVNEVLIPAIVAFEYEHVMASSIPKDLSSSFDETSSSSKISPVTSSSSCSTPKVTVTYPDYTLPNSRGVSHADMWSVSAPQIGRDHERNSLGKNVVAPSASLLLKVENIIKDIVSVEDFTQQTGDGNAVVTPSVAKDSEATASLDAEIKPEEKTEMEIGAGRIHIDAAVTTDTDSSSDSHILEQSSDNIEKKARQQLEAKDATSDNPEFSESEVSNTSSEEESGFMVSLEKIIRLSSDQVDEILDKVSFVLNEERSCWLPFDWPVSADGHDDVEAVSPPPNSVIFAIIQKMQLDKYLERKLMSFFAGRQLTSPGGAPISPVASLSPSALEKLSWNTLSEVNPHSIKVTKWLLETIQKRNDWQGSMNCDLEEMDSRKVRERHLLCEVIQALLDHLNNLSTTRSLNRQTQSDTNMQPGGVGQGGPGYVGTVVSDISLAASELTKEVTAKLLLEDNYH
ncbi:fibrous sheath-interacting protein 2 isoform X3 [Clupea harengus]|uniref:Fibrous sheath-interacting protein 2 isoform X3 n=1 Tax=Clupea harengus TaxID=7950 RepID=A0A6P8H535_CLUHA|nr:fibrous sheath-interacting protein 2 isoform X3 [Clupea harengus]